MAAGRPPPRVGQGGRGQRTRRGDLDRVVDVGQVGQGGRGQRPRRRRLVRVYVRRWRYRQMQCSRRRHRLVRLEVRHGRRSRHGPRRGDLDGAVDVGQIGQGDRGQRTRRGDFDQPLDVGQGGTAGRGWGVGVARWSSTFTTVASYLLPFEPGGCCSSVGVQGGCSGSGRRLSTPGSVALRRVSLLPRSTSAAGVVRREAEHVAR